MSDLSQKIKRAKEEQYSDSEILLFLGQSDESIAGKIAKARDAEYDDADIVQFLATGKPYDRRGTAGAIAQGATHALTDLAGAPVDVMSAVVGGDIAPPVEGSGPGARMAAELQQFQPFKTPPEGAVGGSQSIRRGVENIAEAVGQPRGTFTYNDLTEVHPEERPFAVGGEMFGGSVPFAALPFMRGRAALTEAGRMAQIGRPIAARTFSRPPGAAMDGLEAGAMPKGWMARESALVGETPDALRTAAGSIVNLAKNAPGRFAATEAVSAGGAGVGSGLAEMFDPGDPGSQAIGGMVGGFANVPRALLTGGEKALGGVGSMMAMATPGGREQRAAQVLQDTVRSVGYEPSDVARSIEGAADPSIRMTVGQLTANPALLAMERKLASKDVQFAGRAQENIGRTLEDLRLRIDDLSKSGDPSALTEAAQLRGQYFDRLLQSRVDDADQALAEARARISMEGPGARADASQQANEVLETAIREARQIEGQLWNRVPKNTEVRPDNLWDQVDTIKAELLPREKLTPPVDDFLKSMRERNEPATVGQLLRLRSRSLTLAREARSGGRWGESRHLTMIADSILDDLGKIPGGAAQDARSYSRSMHDAFTRTFAGAALGEKPTGAARIPPELVLERAFGSGGTKGGLQMQELQSAADFTRGPVGELTDTMRAQQNRFLRIAAGEILDNGAVNPDKLERFMRNNTAALDRFPQLRQDLSTVQSAQRAFQEAEAASAQGSKVIAQKAAFSKLLKTERPELVVGEVVTGKNPVRDFNQLARLARRSGPGAIGGLRASAIDYAMNAARQGADGFSFDAFRRAMTTPTGPKQPSLLSMMEQNNVITRAQSERMRQLLERAATIEKGLSTSRQVDEFIPEPDMLTDFVARVVGARLGASTVVGQGAPLVAAGAGSRLTRSLFNNVPGGRIQEVLIQAVEDPKLMIALLRKPTNPKMAAETRRQMNSFLYIAGLTPFMDEE